jgi:hypothetical protein
MLSWMGAVPRFRKKSAFAFFVKIQRKSLMCCLFLAVTALQVGGTFADNLGVSDAVGGAARLIKVREGNVIGRMGGVKISVPNSYLIPAPSVEYKNEDIWRPSKTPPPRSFESEIVGIALLLRDTDFQPITTAVDVEEYQTQYKPSSSKREHNWITIGFQTSFYELGHGSMQITYEGWLRNETNWGPWIPQEADVSGLKHFVSKKQDVNTTTYSPPDEFFYDPLTRNTFITCTNRRRAVPPFDAMSGCEHRFNLPELKAQVSVHYPKDDLPRWKEIEGLIKKMAQGFISP